MRTLIDGYGCCRFCGQNNLIKGVPAGATQAEKDQIATDECRCEAAKMEREIQKAIQRAKRYADIIVKPKSEAAACAIKLCAGDIARGEIGDISITLGRTRKAIAKAGKDHNILVMIRQVIEESSEWEELPPDVPEEID